jgi:hypothetical protein
MQCLLAATSLVAWRRTCVWWLTQNTTTCAPAVPLLSNKWCESPRRPLLTTSDWQTIVLLGKVGRPPPNSTTGCNMGMSDRHNKPPHNPSPTRVM